MEGWISIHRRALESSVWEKDSYWRVWCWCLLKAQHGPAKVPFNGTDIELQAGEFVTGRQRAIKELVTLTDKQYRLALSYLKETSRVAIKSTNKFSIITVLNWEKYQVTKENRASKKEVKGPTKGQQRATYNNGNNENNETLSTNVDNERAQIFGNSELNEVLKYFEKTIVPITSKHKMNRFAMSNLLKKYGKEKVISLINAAAASNDDQYGPRIANPLDLQEKLANLALWAKKQGKSKVIKIR